MNENADDLLAEHDGLFTVEADGGNGVATGELAGRSDGQGQETNGSAPVARENGDGATDLAGEIDGGGSPPEDLLTEDGAEE